MYLLMLAKEMKESLESNGHVSKTEKDILIDKAIKASASFFCAQDPEGKIFLDYVNGEIQKELLCALDEVSDASDEEYQKKVEILLNSAVAQKNFAIFDEEGNLTNNNILYYLLNQGAWSFRRLEAVGFKLSSAVPGEPEERCFFDYYFHCADFYHYLSENIDNLSEHEITRFTLLPILLKKNVSLEDLYILFLRGSIAIDAPEYDLAAVKQYVAASPQSAARVCLFNTITLFEDVFSGNREGIAKEVESLLYPLAFNQEGKTIIHLLAEKGYEEAVITILNRHSIRDPLVIYDEKKETLWHLCVRNNLDHVLRYLISSQPQNVDCFSQEGLTPFALAMCLGNLDVAETLTHHGANGAPTVGTQGATLFHLAVSKRDKALIVHCRTRGLSVNVPDALGYTARWYAKQQADSEIMALLKSCLGSEAAEQTDLWNAIQRGEREVLEAMIEGGANLNVTDVYGCAALDWARLYEQEEIEKVIEDAGGEPHVVRSTLLVLRMHLNHYKEEIVRRRETIEQGSSSSRSNPQKPSGPRI